MECKVGVLAIQGAFLEHQICLQKAMKAVQANIKKPFNLHVIEVRDASAVNGLDALVIPGGESTSMGKSLERDGFGDQIKQWLRAKTKPVVWGTCAGMIMLANDLEGTKAGGQAHLGGLDIKVSRNFFGRQINSFEAAIDIKADELKLKTGSRTDETYHGVFIRAPAVSSCESNKVEILGTVDHPGKSDSAVIVAVKQDNIIATAFHPELTDDLRWHEYFLNIVLSRKIANCNV